MLKPLQDYVVVLPSDPEKKTPGGLVIVDTAQQKSTEGIVLEVGPGTYLPSGQRISCEVEKGCKVLFSKGHGTEIEFDGKKCLLMREGSILAILA